MGIASVNIAAELVALAPDVILANGASIVGPLQRMTRTVPIVFVNVTDPVGAGIRREPGAAGRQRHRLYLVRIWHQREMARAAQEIAPRVTRVGVLRDPAYAAGTGQLAAMQSVAPSFGVELRPIDVRDPA